MSLLELYRAHLAAPKSSQLTSDASLTYVPTGISVSGSVDVLKHLEGMSSHAVRDDSRELNVVEGESSLCVETAATIEIVSGGGAYTPDLSANYVAGRTATLPFVHVVQFEKGLISAIRMYWDQGALLRDLDIISSKGTSWPIRSGSSQVKQLVSLTRSAWDVDEEPVERKRSILESPSKRMTTEFRQIMLGEEPAAGESAPPFPDLGQAKRGASKPAPANRLFESDALPPVLSKPRTTNQSTWSFEDFSTPIKTKPRMRQGQRPTYAWDDQDDVAGTAEPTKKPARARFGTESQFEITDEVATPAPRKVVDRRDLSHNPLMDACGPDEEARDAKSQSDLQSHFETHPENRPSRREFGTQFELTDDSPRPDRDEPAEPVRAPGQKSKSLAPSWDFGCSDDEKEGGRPARQIKPRARKVTDSSTFWDDFN